MFHMKDQCVLEYLDELSQMGLGYLRVDLRHTNQDLLIQIFDLARNFSKHKANKLRELYPNKITRGYFSVNKTDAVFSKLKNQRLLKSDENYMGEVLEVLKDRYLVVGLKNDQIKLKVGQLLKMITPLGEEVHLPVLEIKNSSMKDVEELKCNGIALINYVSKSSSKAQIYLVDG